MWHFCSQKVLANGNERFHGLYIYLKIYIDLCIDLVYMKWFFFMSFTDLKMLLMRGRHTRSPSPSQSSNVAIRYRRSSGCCAISPQTAGGFTSKGRPGYENHHPSRRGRRCNHSLGVFDCGVGQRWKVPQNDHQQNNSNVETRWFCYRRYSNGLLRTGFST